eukprot:TRINITY_DN5215_c0_g1_i2.p1 TRINITY_DN5215_c0_g1~~TRINITY_DN5215_c0_g1_i2.p1  ORF type:complete len:537 (-),score=40.34 TRINITY_DN5215_c0_g1_i2:639-2066(-)
MNRNSSNNNNNNNNNNNSNDGDNVNNDNNTRVGYYMTPMEDHQSLQKISMNTLAPIEIARQLTLMDEYLYNQIPIHQFMHHSKLKKEETNELTRFINHNNRMTNWITTEILKFQRPADRAQRISKLITVAEHLNLMKNYNGLITVTSSLNNLCLESLKRTCNLKQAYMLRQTSYNILPIPEVQRYLSNRTVWSEETCYSISSLLTSFDEQIPSGSLNKLSGSTWVRIYKEKDLELTQRDWNVLLTIATKKIYNQGEKILRQGTKNSNLYIVKQGRVKIVKSVYSRAVVLKRSNELYTIFGELSLLTKKKTTASIIAEDTIEVWVLHELDLLNFCQLKEDLSRKLHYLLCNKLANLIKELNDRNDYSQFDSADMMIKHSSPNNINMRSRSQSLSINQQQQDVSSSNDNTLSVLSEQDKNFHRTFGYSQLEVLIQEFNCDLWIGKIKAPGSIYISPNFLSFTVTLFGFQKKDQTKLK